MRDETLWELADFYEVEGPDGQPVVPKDSIDELAREVWKHNRNSKSHTRREESIADMLLFRYQGVSKKEVAARANKIYMELERRK